MSKLETKVELEIKNMLRHIHRDVENLKRKQEILEVRIMNVAYLVQSGSSDKISDIEMDSAVNLDPDIYRGLEEIYTPLDEVDEIVWGEHLIKEKEKDLKE